MKALVLDDYGGSDRLAWRDVPEPKPGPGEVKVALAATSVNPIDYKLRSGVMRARVPLQFPAILGRDIAGVVSELGSGVTRWRVGDRVLGLGSHSYAEQATIAADALARVPEGLDLAEAAALPLVLTTGGQLVERIAPQAGETILVTGAVGSVGRAAVFAARQRGARVLAGVRRKQQAAAAELGAAQVVALDDEGALERLPTLDSIADTVGGETTAKLLPRLKKGGVLGSVVGEPPGAKDKPIEVRPMMAQPDAALLARLTEAVARQELRIPIGLRLPLSRAGEGQRAMEEHKAEGKVLLLVANR